MRTATSQQKVQGDGSQRNSTALSEPDCTADVRKANHNPRKHNRQAEKMRKTRDTRKGSLVHVGFVGPVRFPL